MSSTDFQLVALDLDGTVLDSAGQVSAAFKAVASELRKLGVRTVMCTGRRWRTALPIIRQIQHAHPYVICCGGALIKDGRRHTTLYTNPLGIALARPAVEGFRKAGLVPFLLYDRPLRERELLISDTDRERAKGLAYVADNAAAFEPYPDGFPAVREAPLVVYTVDEPERVCSGESIVQGAVGKDALVAVLRHPHGGRQWALEVHSLAASKWAALSWLLERWKVPPSRVVAIGDDVNDIPMLEAAGLSFAMGNAVPAAKAAADRLTADNDQDGAALALRSVFALGPEP